MHLHVTPQHARMSFNDLVDWGFDDFFDVSDKWIQAAREQAQRDSCRLLAESTTEAADKIEYAIPKLASRATAGVTSLVNDATHLLAHGAQFAGKMRRVAAGARDTAEKSADSLAEMLRTNALQLKSTASALGTHVANLPTLEFSKDDALFIAPQDMYMPRIAAAYDAEPSMAAALRGMASLMTEFPDKEHTIVSDKMHDHGVHVVTLLPRDAHGMACPYLSVDDVEVVFSSSGSTDPFVGRYVECDVTMLDTGEFSIRIAPLLRAHMPLDVLRTLRYTVKLDGVAMRVFSRHPKYPSNFESHGSIGPNLTPAVPTHIMFDIVQGVMDVAGRANGTQVLTLLFPRQVLDVRFAHTRVQHVQIVTHAALQARLAATFPAAAPQHWMYAVAIHDAGQTQLQCYHPVVGELRMLGSFGLPPAARAVYDVQHASTLHRLSVDATGQLVLDTNAQVHEQVVPLAAGMDAPIAKHLVFESIPVTAASTLSLNGDWMAVTDGKTRAWVVNHAALPAGANPFEIAAAVRHVSFVSDAAMLVDAYAYADAVDGAVYLKALTFEAGTFAREVREYDAASGTCVSILDTPLIETDAVHAQLQKVTDPALRFVTVYLDDSGAMRWRPLQ